MTDRDEFLTAAGRCRAAVPAILEHLQLGIPSHYEVARALEQLFEQAGGTPALASIVDPDGGSALETGLQRAPCATSTLDLILQRVLARALARGLMDPAAITRDFVGRIVTGFVLEGEGGVMQGLGAAEYHKQAARIQEIILPVVSAAAEALIRDPYEDLIDIDPTIAEAATYGLVSGREPFDYRQSVLDVCRRHGFQAVAFLDHLDHAHSLLSADGAQLNPC